MTPILVPCFSGRLLTCQRPVFWLCVVTTTFLQILIHRMTIIICFLCSVTVENIVICMWCLDTHPVNSLLEHSYFWGMAWIKWDHTGEISIVCGQWGCLYLYVIMGPRSIYIHLFLIMYHFLYYCHAPLPKIRGNGVGTRVGDTSTQGKYLTYTR